MRDRFASRSMAGPVVRGGKVVAQRSLETEVSRPFYRVAAKALCACKEITISGGPFLWCNGANGLLGRGD